MLRSMSRRRIRSIDSMSLRSRSSGDNCRPRFWSHLIWKHRLRNRGGRIWIWLMIWGKDLQCSPELILIISYLLSSHKTLSARDKVSLQTGKWPHNTNQCSSFLGSLNNPTPQTHWLSAKPQAQELWHLFNRSRNSTKWKWCRLHKWYLLSLKTNQKFPNPISMDQVLKITPEANSLQTIWLKCRWSIRWLQIKICFSKICKANHTLSQPTRSKCKVSKHQCEFRI